MDIQKPMKTPNKRDPQTYAIIGAAMEVHKRLGHGFLEAVYQEAATLEFSHNIIVEFKALSRLCTREEAQVFNYLKATGYQRALLINFGASSLGYKRLVWGYPNKKSAPSVAASA